MEICFPVTQFFIGFIKKTYSWWWLISYYCLSVKETRRERVWERVWSTGAPEPKRNAITSLQMQLKEKEGECQKSRMGLMDLKKTRRMVHLGKSESSIYQAAKPSRAHHLSRRYTAHLSGPATPRGGAGGTRHRAPQTVLTIRLWWRGKMLTWVSQEKTTS